MFSIIFIFDPMMSSMFLIRSWFMCCNSCSFCERMLSSTWLAPLEKKSRGLGALRGGTLNDLSSSLFAYMLSLGLLGVRPMAKYSSLFFMFEEVLTGYGLFVV